MSKTIFSVLAIPFSVFIFSALLISCNAKVKDADIKASIDKAYATNPDLSMVMVGVNDGTATLTGEVKDAAVKSDAEAKAKDVKGVTAVVNNISITPSAPPVVITADDPLKISVDNTLRDYPGVTATINDGVVTLTGEIKKADLQKLMMALNSLKPKKVENKLVIK